MNNNERFIIGCILISIGIFIIAVSVSFLFTGCSSAPEEPYIMTEEESQLIDLIYRYRNVWESSDEKNATFIRLKKTEDYYFLLVTLSKGEVKQSKDGVTVLGLETKYTVNLKEEKVYQTLFKEDNSQSVGIVHGIVKYNVSNTKEDKLNSIAKAVIGKSVEITDFSVYD